MKYQTLVQSNHTADRLVAILKDVALLIGPTKLDPFTLQNNNTVIPGLGMETAAKTLLRMVSNIDQKLFTLLVLGEFKNGKSTLINAILGEEKLPARAIPTTAVITILVQGTRSDVAIYRIGIDEPEYIPWSEFIDKYRLTAQDKKRMTNGETLNRFKDIEYAQIETQHNICRNRVRIVDSPGLGEDHSRTQLTTRFLKEAQAVVCVLNARKPLAKNEIDFLDSEFDLKQIDHLFFVVNRINEVEDSEQVEEIKELFKVGLEERFADESGGFDEAFYNRRMFFVNALGGLKAKIANPVDEVAWVQSNVGSLEKELKDFLGSSHKAQAEYESTLTQLTRLSETAVSNIDFSRAALSQDVENLRRRQKEAEEKLSYLSTKKKDIGAQIIFHGENIFEQLWANFGQFLEKMKEEWPNEPKEVVDLSKIDPSDLVKALKDERVAKKIEKELNKVVSQYLQTKFRIWAHEAQEAIADKLAILKQKVTNDVRDFMSQIAEIEADFALVKSQKRTVDLRGRLQADYVAKAPDIATGDWSVTIAQSLTGLAEVFKIFGTNAVKVYAWLYPVSDKAFKDIDSILKSDFRENHLQTRMANFRNELGKRIYDILRSEHESRVATIKATDFTNFLTFAKHLRDGKEELSSFLWQGIPENEQKIINLAVERPTRGEKIPRTHVAKRLQEVMSSGENLYIPERFGHIHLRKITRNKAEDPDIGGIHLTQLNRWLLNEAYPNFIPEKLHDSLYHGIMYEFFRLEKEATEPLRGYIEELSQKMQDIIDKLDQKQEVEEVEKARLDQIEQLLQELVSEAQTLVSGSMLDEHYEGVDI